MASVTVNSELKIFEILKRYMRLMGIYGAPKRYKRINITLIQRALVLTFMAFLVLETVAYSMFEAESASELPQTNAYTSGFTLAFIWYSIFIWKRETIEYFLGTIQKKMENRETFVIQRRSALEHIFE